MKALTLQQPYAQLVALGVKSIETRGRQTSHRGRVAIHAGVSLASIPERGTLELGDFDVWRHVGEWAPGASLQRAGASTATTLPIGAVVATANLVDVVAMVDFWPIPERRGAQPLLYVGSRYRLTLWRRGFDAEPVDVEAERPYGHFAPGRAAWLLEDIEPLENPVPAKGALGLWDWNEEAA